MCSQIKQFVDQKAVSSAPSKIPQSELPFIFSGKRLLRNEISLLDSEFNSLLKSGYFNSTSGLQKTLFFQKCQRCGNENRSLIGVIPCSLCKITHHYCRKCIQMGRIMQCTYLYEWAGSEPQWPKWQQPLKWRGQLTNLQQEASNRVIDAVQSGSGELLLWAVCGAGKTEMLFEGIAAGLKLGKRICLATPRADVVRELLPRFREAFPELKVEALYGGSEDKLGRSQLILATTHQLLRFYKAFDCLIIDEVDAFPFHKEDMLQYAAKQVVKDKHTLIYLTATPRQDLVFRTKINDIPHHFIPSRFHGFPLPVPKSILSYDLPKRLKKSLPPKHFLKWLDNRENDMRQILIFVPTIRMAEELYGNISHLLILAKIIKSETEIAFVHAEDERRSDFVQAFRLKELKVLITTTILERGVTFPSVDVIVIDAGHHVFDEAALVQIAGRAGRATDDPTGEVLFYHHGKTNAIVRAIKSIKSMNKRGRL